MLSLTTVKSPKYGYYFILLAAITAALVHVLSKPLLEGANNQIEINPIVMAFLIYFICGIFFTPIVRKTKSNQKITKKDFTFMAAIATAEVTASFQHPIQFTALPIRKAVNLLISTETERINKLKKSGPELEEMWEKIPVASSSKEDDDEEKFKVLQGGNQVNSKIFDMILNAKNECRVLGSEKDFMKFYHANFLDALEEHSIDYKLLTPISNKSKYIFEDIDQSKIKQLCPSVKENLCFLIKDDDEVLFFIKNEGNNKEMRAIWTNSETIIYSKALLFNNIWSKTDSTEIDAQ